jgi:hypothetical protein
MKLHPNHRSKASNLGGDGRTLTYGRGSDGGAASEGLEAGVDDLAGALVDADLHLHDVAAGRRADQPGADVGVVLVEGSDVPWVVVVVHHPLVVRPQPGRHRRRARLAGAQAEPPEPRREEPSSSRAQHRPQTWSRLWILLFFFRLLDWTNFFWRSPTIVAVVCSYFFCGAEEVGSGAAAWLRVERLLRT